MHRRDTIVIWFGGIFTETVDELTLKLLLDKGQAQGKHELRLKLNRLAEELCLGKITEKVFCQQALIATNSTSSIQELEHMIIQSGLLQKSVMELVEDIPSKYALWLISDYPRNWYEPLSTRLRTLDLFPTERTIFPADGDLAKMVPDLLHYILNRVNRPQTECIVIDSVSARAVEAVRYGISSIIYVCPEQLMHEFELRGIRKVDTEVLHPSGSKRVLR